MITRDGLVVTTSTSSAADTIANIDAALAANDAVRVIANIDHQANAPADVSLRPTRVMMFGNPTLGTPLMVANQIAGLDLPQKMLVWEDAEGTVRLGYNSPGYVAQRHGLTGVDDSLMMIGGALRNIANNATGATDTVSDAPPTMVTAGAGVVTVVSANDFESTYSALKGALEAIEPISIVAEIDHASNAMSIGTQLRPTRLVVFGNPAVGSPLMASGQTVGVDLPQKMLVFEAEDGTVSVAYNDPSYLATRHELADQDERLMQLKTVLEGLAASATTAL